MNKSALAAIPLVALLAIALVVSSYSIAMAQVSAAAAPPQAAKGGNGNDAGGKQNKCNNVKIMAVVTGLDTTKGIVTLKGSATLQGQTVTKTIRVNTTETSESDGIGIPLFFKKAFQPCPAIGTPYSGAVNDTTFASTLTSISRPNVVEVDITGAGANVPQAAVAAVPQAAADSPMVLGEPQSQK